jgi:serine/threonine protein kinase
MEWVLINKIRKSKYFKNISGFKFLDNKYKVIYKKEENLDIDILKFKILEQLNLEPYFDINIKLERKQPPTICKYSNEIYNLNTYIASGTYGKVFIFEEYAVKIFKNKIKGKVEINDEGLIFYDDLLDVSISSFITSLSFNYPNMLQTYGFSIYNNKLAQVMEKGNNALYEILNNENLYYYLFQIVFSIEVLKKYKIQHNDLTLSNILLFNFNSDKKYLKYTLNNIDYYLPNTGLILKIIDFSLSQKFLFPQIKDNSIISFNCPQLIEYNIIDKYMPSYDIMTVLIDIFKNFNNEIFNILNIKVNINNILPSFRPNESMANTKIDINFNVFNQYKIEQDNFIFMGSI